MKVDLAAVGLIGFLLCAGGAIAQQKVDPKFDKVQCHAWTGGVGAQSHSYAECNEPAQQTQVVVLQPAPAPAPAQQLASPPVVPKPIRQ